MGAVYLLTLRQISGRWRILIMTVLAAMPVLVAVLTMANADGTTVREFETFVFSVMLAGSIAPLTVLAIATAAFGNELEDRTLANLTLTPIPRWEIALPKFLATMTLAVPFIGVSAYATSQVAFLADTQATIAVTLGAVVGVVLYSAMFVWLGLVSAQAIGVGLLYIVLWEGFFSGFVAGVRMLSIRHYTLALIHGLDDRRFAWGDHPSLIVVVAVAVLVATGFGYLTVRRLRTMDVP